MGELSITGARPVSEDMRPKMGVRRLPNGWFWLMVGMNVENLGYWSVLGFTGNLIGFRPEVALAMALPVLGMVITSGIKIRKDEAK